jgi:hypothetical protein
MASPPSSASEGPTVWLECAIVVEPEEGFAAPLPRPLRIDESKVQVGPQVEGPWRPELSSGQSSRGMSGPTQGRSTPNNTTLLDQADFFSGDGFRRVPGLTPGDVTCLVFFNNLVQPWALVPGVAVSDAQVQSGRIYWSEIPGASGYYSLRWRPNATGYWRVLVNYPAGLQVIARDYDVVAQGNEGCSPGGGVKVSFVGKGC